MTAQTVSCTMMNIYSLLRCENITVYVNTLTLMNITAEENIINLFFIYHPFLTHFQLIAFFHFFGVKILIPQIKVAMQCFF